MTFGCGSSTPEIDADAIESQPDEAVSMSAPVPPVVQPQPVVAPPIIQPQPVVNAPAIQPKPGEPDATTTIGKWNSERQFAKEQLRIFRNGDDFFMETTYEDNSTGAIVIRETKTESGQRFDAADEKDFAIHYWVINSDGDLEVHSLRDGSILNIAKKLQ